MPKYMLSIVETEAEYASGGAADFDAVMKDHVAFAEAVKAAGASIVSSEALQPMATATFLRGTCSDGVQAVDNPLPEIKELLGGYYLLEVADQAQAIELGKLCPAPFGYIEVRPIWDLS